MRLILCLVALVVTTAHAADGENGKRKAATCSACHGPAGISSNDIWPNLAGQKQAYLVKQLKAFHQGVRNDPLMGPVSKMLNDQDMQDLAAYFAQLKGAQ